MVGLKRAIHAFCARMIDALFLEELLDDSVKVRVPVRVLGKLGVKRRHKNITLTGRDHCFIDVYKIAGLF